jgi:hypothetical protein
MTDRITFVPAVSSERIADSSALSITARFRASGADVTPTNVYYRLDDPDSGEQLADWTSATPGTTAVISTTSSHNTARRCKPIERRQLTVMADRGLSTQFAETYLYEIRNNAAIRYS